MKNTIKSLIAWRDRMRLNKLSDMSARTAFWGMVFSGFVGSFYALIVGSFYYDYIVITNKIGLFNIYALAAGLILAGCALLALVFGLVFQICNKVFIAKIFEDDRKD
jgi:hypothetical protein